MYVLDTNVLKVIGSERPPTAARPWENVQNWFRKVDETTIFLSPGTVMENRAGIEELKESKPEKAAEIENKLKAILTAFADRILPVTLDVAEEWGKFCYAHGGDYILDNGAM